MILLTFLQGEKDRAGNHWFDHGGATIYAEHPNPGRAYALCGVRWGGKATDLRKVARQGRRWVVWDARPDDVVGQEGDVVWARQGTILFSGEYGDTAGDFTEDALNFYYEAQREERLERMKGTDFDALAKRIFETPKDEPLGTETLLRALRYPPGEKYYLEGGVPSSLTHPPYVRLGDVVEVDTSGSVQPVAGAMAAAVYRTRYGENGDSYLSIGLDLIYERPDGTLLFGPKHPLEEVRLIGVVTRHQWRLDGSGTGTTTRWIKAGALPFYLTPSAPQWKEVSHDPEGLRL